MTARQTSIESAIERAQSHFAEQGLGVTEVGIARRAMEVLQLRAKRTFGNSEYDTVFERVMNTLRRRHEERWS